MFNDGILKPPTIRDGWVGGKRPLPFDATRFVLAHEFALSLEYVMNSRRFGTTVTVTP